MKSELSYPICPYCHAEQIGWEDRVPYSDIKYNRALNFKCLECQKEYIALRTTKEFWEIQPREYVEKVITFTVPTSYWVALFKRPDGSMFIGSHFDTKEELLDFYKHNDYGCKLLSIAEFKGEFKEFI